MAKRRNPEKTAVETAERPNVSIAFIIICAVLALSPLVAGKLTPIPALITQLLTLAAASAWIIASAKQGSINLPERKTAVAVAIIYAFLLLSAVGSGSAHATIRELLNISAYLLIFLMIAGVKDAKNVYGMIAALVISAILVGTFGLKEYMLTGDPSWRVFSTFFNPGFLAGFMVIVLPIALAWYLSRISAGITAVSAAAVILTFANIIMAGARFGAFAAAGGIIAFVALAILSKAFKRPQAVRALIIIVPILLIYLSLGTPLAERVSSIEEQAHSGGFRIHTWQGTLKMAADNPLNGTGLGTFEIAYPQYALVGYTKLAHNSYLQIAAEAGIPAALALIALLKLILIPALVSLWRNRSSDIPPQNEEQDFRWTPEPKLLMCGLISAAVASMARNLADSDWYICAIGVAFWAVLGSVIALGGSTRSNPLNFGRKQANVVLGIFAAAFILLSTMLASETLVKQSENAWMRDPSAGYKTLNLAAKLDPLNPDPQRRLASANMAMAFQYAADRYSQEAEASMLRAISLEPVNAKNHYRLGKLYESLDKPNEAISAYEAARARDPNAPEVMLALAELYTEVGRTEDAVKVWERMAQVEETVYEQVRAVPELVTPEYIFAHAALGAEYERAGNPKLAEKHYRRALERISRYERSMESMAEVLEAGGRRDRETERRVQSLKKDILNRLKDMSFSY